MMQQSAAAAVAAALLAPLPGFAACDDDAKCRGITASVLYTGEEMRNQSGGLRTGSDYLSNLDLQLAADRGSLFGIPGLAGFLYVLHNNEATFSEDHVGDVQVVSNIDATRALRVFELWLDWAPGAEDGFSVRAGLYDLNSEFDESDTAGLFVNSSHGINPTFSLTGQNGPSIFPVSSLALRLKGPVGPVEGGYWQAAVLDGVPGDPDDPASNRIDLSRDDGALLVVEAGLSRDAWRKLAIGAWYYTAEFDTLEETDASGDPVRDRGNGGFYAIADRVLVEGDGPRLAGFLRAGYGAQRFNQVGYYVGAGLVAESFLAQRPEDQLGLALASAINGNDYVHAERLAGNDPGRHETVLELTWRAPLADWLTVQPGLQYVIHPGTDESLDNALVLGLRFEVGWSRTF